MSAASAIETSCSPETAPTGLPISTAISGPAETPPILPEDSSTAPAYALVSDVYTQATRQEVLGFRDHLKQLKTLIAILRAEAEQLRRVADCQRTLNEAFLTHTAQPGFVLDCDGRITRWNAALADWSGITAEQAEGRDLSELFPAETSSWLQSATRKARKRVVSQSSNAPLPALSSEAGLSLTFAEKSISLTLLPMQRIPGCVEAFLFLLTPAC